MVKNTKNNDFSKYPNENKISIILNEIFTYFVHCMDFDMYIDNGEIKIDDDMYNDLIVFIHQIYDEIKNVNFEIVVDYDTKRLIIDDYFCLLLYDENHNIVKWVIWDFDFIILDENTLLNIDYRFENCKNVDDILSKFE